MIIVRVFFDDPTCTALAYSIDARPALRTATCQLLFFQIDRLELYCFQRLQPVP